VQKSNKKFKTFLCHYASIIITSLFWNYSWQ